MPAETAVQHADAAHADAALIRQVNQHFHNLTQTTFDDVHRHRYRAERRFWEKVADLTLDLSKKSAACDRDAGTGRVVVDLACGTGFVTQTLGVRLGAMDRLIAIDLGESALKTTGQKWLFARARRPDGPRLERLAGDGQAIPLADASVDLLAINAALHHLPDPKAALRDIDRVLKPGGHFALGFEPNRTHFASSMLAGLSNGLSRLGWYASPQQNWRRLSNFLQPAARPNASPACPGRNDVLAAAMNEQLLRDGLVEAPLPPSRLLDLVDPHARGAGDEPGFNPEALVRETMPNYRLLVWNSSDYLGETARRSPLVRCVVDAVFQTLLPRHGTLFSWLLRKPVPAKPIEPVVRQPPSSNASCGSE